jgi:L-alanine-DL-glutamate epimerase-like enolase superfamily enzyme
MTGWTRRDFTKSLAAAGVLAGIPRRARAAVPNPHDIVVDELKISYEDFLYRTPIKFGGNVLDRVTLLNVHCTLHNRAGKVAHGFGSMPMGNVWSWPSHVLKYADTLAAMKGLAEQVAKITTDYKQFSHPVELNVALEPAYFKAAAEFSTAQQLAEPIPKLCSLVTVSPFDAAIHDAYGKLNGLNCYHTYGAEFLNRDLSDFLGAEFRGEHLDQYVLTEPKPRMPLYHLIGALDPLEEQDIVKRIGDGLPETLAEWIPYNGLTHLKIKLNGSDLKWDVERVLRVERTTAAAQLKRGAKAWVYSADFNEKCPNVEYLLGFLRQVKEQAPAAFERLQYVEQPTKRDLKADRANVMTEASKLKPVVIDESLTDQEALMLAREMGYTGVALKACKSQSQALLMAAVAQKYKMFLCVQDLTCPGASLLHSAGISAHIPGVAAIEANGRQYCPAANEPWVKKFPDIFIVKDGTMGTACLNKPGLGVVD